MNGRIEVHPVDFGLVEGILRNLQWQLQVGVAPVAVGGIANTFEHHHAPRLAVVDEVLAEVPGGREHFLLDEPGDELFLGVGLLGAELVGGVGDLVGVGDVLDAHLLEHLLPELGTLVLAHILGGDQRPKLLIIVLLTQRTILVSVYFYLYFLHDLLEYLVVDVGEEPVEFHEADIIIVLLEEADDVGLGASLDEVLILPRLGVVHL